MVFYMYGPEVGRRHDITLFRKSDLDNLLQNMLHIDSVRYCIYGEAAYMLRPWLQTAFPIVTAEIAELEYNTAMNGDGTAVEWSYKDLKQVWTSQDFKRSLKVHQSPIALLYKSAALLWNFRCCLRDGNQTTSHLSCSLPNFSKYLREE